MKRKCLFALTFMLIGILATGCGNRGKISTTQAGQENTKNEAAYGMEAKAPKTENDTGTKETQRTADGEEKAEETQTGVSAETDNEQGTGATESASDAGLTETQAKEKALQDAGVSEDDITGIRIKREKDDGQEIYDVEFYVGQQEYDYEIDILTGKIIDKDYEIDNDFAHRTSADSEAMLSQEEAIAIVLAKVNGASEENVFIELEEDDGQWKYEGEIQYNQKEYEFEVNAINGTILEWSEENLNG